MFHTVTVGDISQVPEFSFVYVTFRDLRLTRPPPPPLTTYITESTLSSNLLPTSSTPQLQHHCLRTKRPYPTMAAHNTTQTFNFLRLPPEVRNSIYVYVFGARHIKLASKFNSTSRPYQYVPEGIVRPANNGSKDARENTYGKPSHTFALLKTCRQIHAETHMLPFELNTFDISRHDSEINPLKLWSETLAKQLRAIRTVRIQTDNAVMEIMFPIESLKLLAGLKRVEVVVVVAAWDFAGMQKRRRRVTRKEVEIVEENKREFEDDCVLGLGSKVEVNFL
jgi:hypothetical protein